MKFFIFLFIFMNILDKNAILNSDVKTIDNSKKNLMITSVSNYNWNNIAVFFKSYQKVNFENTDFVVYVHNVTEKTIEKMKSCGAIVYPFPDEYKTVNVINSRWKLYSEYLKNNPNKYNLVFTGDSRDIIFQRDIFKVYKDIKKPFLGLAIEDGFISQEPLNKIWVIDAYGEELFNTIKDKRIICLGTIWGTADKFLEFVDTMWNILSSEWGVKGKVIDQGVGNYIVYHDKMWNDCIIFSENRDGPVMTLALTNRAFINLDSDNNILNVIGEVASVVHQYDRKEDITKITKNKYCPELIEKIEKKEKNNSGIIIFIFLIGVILFAFLIGLRYIYKNKITMSDTDNKCK